jgi:hypothetical protein
MQRLIDLDTNPAAEDPAGKNAADHAGDFGQDRALERRISRLDPACRELHACEPYGRIEGRQTYLDWVRPLAARNVTQLRILRTLSDANQAAIHFEMQTPNRAIQVCDWIVVENGQIREIHSFYDATELRSSA